MSSASTRHEPQGMRDTVVAAAVQVIQERGLARTRTSHIARAAGCAEGSIYRYLSGKSELMREVLRSRLQDVIGVLADLRLRAGTPTVEANLLEAARGALASYREGVTPLLPRHRRDGRRRRPRRVPAGLVTTIADGLAPHHDQGSEER